MSHLPVPVTTWPSIPQMDQAQQYNMCGRLLGMKYGKGRRGNSVHLDASHSDAVVKIKTAVPGRVLTVVGKRYQKLNLSDLLGRYRDKDKGTGERQVKRKR